MKATVDYKKGLKTNIKVVVDKKTIDNEMIARFEELKKTINLKGFRPGKVPIEILKKQFGKAVYSQILDKVLKESSAKALKENKIRPAGQPKIDLKSHGENKNLEYIIEIEQLPKIAIKEIKNIKIKNYEIKVSDKDIDKRIKDIAKNQNNFKDRKEQEPASKGDLVIFDYKTTVNEKTYEGGEGKTTQIILGKDLFIKGFDKQLIGLKKQEEKLVDIILPENYPNKNYANKKAKFFCKIINIKKPEEVIINDEFAKSLGAQDMKDLKSVVSKQIQDQYKNTLDAIAKKKIIAQLNEFKDIQIPNSLIKQEIEILAQGMEKDEADKNKNLNEKKARKRIKVGLILNEFGEQNNIKVDEGEIRSEIQKHIKMMPGQEKQVTEYYKKNPSALASLRGGIYEEKIISLIKDKAVSSKETISTEEAEKIIIDGSKETTDIIEQKPKIQKIVKKKLSKLKKVSKK